MYKITNVEHLMPRLTKNGQNCVAINTLEEQEYLIFHNDGVVMEDNADATKRAIADAEYYANRVWYGYSSPYHFLIGRKEDDEILQALPLGEVTYHCSNDFYSLRSLAITFQGNYQLQTLTETQKKKAEWLIGYLKELLPNLKGINYHRMVGAMSGIYTDCPSKNAIPVVESFMRNFNNINDNTMTKEEAKKIVYAMYREVLGREPESEKVVEDWADWIEKNSVSGFITILPTLPEYKLKKEILLKSMNNGTISEADQNFYFNDLPKGIVRSIPEILQDKGYFN